MKTTRMKTAGSAVRAAAALGAAALLLLTGCGGPPTGYEVHQVSSLSIAAPQEWVESPDDALDERWQFGLDDTAEQAPQIRLRVAPVYGSSPHPVNAESTLFADAEIGGLYGPEYHADVREHSEFPGARTGFTTEFTYRSPQGVPMSGRWWFLADPDTGQVTGIELVGETEALDDELIEEIEQSIALEPGRDSGEDA